VQTVATENIALRDLLAAAVEDDGETAAAPLLSGVGWKPFCRWRRIRRVWRLRDGLKAEGIASA